MNFRLLFGLAALALGSTAHALTITQSQTLTYGGSASLNGVLSQAYWNFEPFAVPNATLTSVTLTATIASSRTDYEQNPFSFPYNYTPQHTHRSLVDVGNGPFHVFSSSEQMTAVSGPTTIIAPFTTSGVRFSSTASHSFTETMIAPEVLEAFTNPNTHVGVHSTFNSVARFGGMSSSHTAAVTLTFNYTVPDGSSFPLLAVVVALLLWRTHRRWSVPT